MSEQIKENIKAIYSAVVEKDSPKNTSCCESSCCSPGEDFNFQDRYTHLEGYQPEADYGLGCGIPTEFAQIKAGDIVLDLGSGAGNDAFVARKIVGETGHVIGVDMTKAMIERANANKEKLGFTNVTFLEGEIEQLPLNDQSVDVVISNCVMNLVPDKRLAYQEVHRVLKSNGHLSISDIVLEGKLPDKIKNAATMYAGCVAGAMQKDKYMEIITASGFPEVKIVQQKAITLPDDLLLKYLNAAELEDFKSAGTKLLSITVYAEK